MKHFLQILFLFLVWFTNLNATPIFTKVTLPSYNLSFPIAENVKEESVVKIGVAIPVAIWIARSEITKNEPQNPYLHVGSFFKTLFSNEEKGNFRALTFKKDLSKSQYSSFNFSEKEQLSLLENRARDELVKYVQGAGKLLDDIVLAIKAYFPTHGNPMNLLMKVTPNNTEVA